MSTLSHFSHIYIEERAAGYPLTADLVARFSKAATIPIANYKEVFNRPRQSWELQKNSLKLILAVREDNFLYPGSAFVPNFDHSRFFYTTPVLNCIYGCQYCYLQGMFPSANLVAFVNTDDLIKAAERELGDNAPAYLCISYDTDLLALEDLFGYCKSYIEYATRAPNVTIEIRTKSVNIKPLKVARPVSNVILAWTLSPDYVTDRYEHGTPKLKARLNAVSQALKLGWRVRLCIDPILRVSDWRAHYSELVEAIFSEVHGAALYDVSLGVFRIASGYLRAMRESGASNTLAHYPYAVSNQSASYSDEERLEMLEHLTIELSKYLPKEKICPVLWQL